MNMPREGLQDKALRLIKEDRVMVLNSDYFRIIAKVQGDSGIYRVEVQRGMKFNCECNWFTHSDGTIECAHILAVKLLPLHATWFNMEMDVETKKIRYKKDMEAIRPLVDVDAILQSERDAKHD